VPEGKLLVTVGVFDSGVGGLSVLRALRAELHQVHFVYLADNAYAPYGEQAADAVIARAHQLTKQLRTEHKVQALVVACNTATALAVDDLRKTHPDLPFIGVEPALKPSGDLVAQRSHGRTRHARHHAECALRVFTRCGESSSRSAAAYPLPAV
jgi:glutamate racemase